MSKVAACVVLSIPLHVTVHRIEPPRWGPQAIVLARPPHPFPPPSSTVPPITFVIGPPAGPPPTTPRPTNRGRGAVRTLEQIARCESGGNYGAVSKSGKYGGAYQFDRGSWAANAPEGWQDVAPQDAPPEVQDQAAATLYERRGAAPWPTCGR